MSKLKLLVMIVFLAILVAPFAVHGAGPKTYLGVSGISFDYLPFWYAKDYLLPRGEGNSGLNRSLR